MARKLKVLVACGSEVETSTIAKVPDKQTNIDMVLTKASYRKWYLLIFCLISRFNKI